VHLKWCDLRGAKFVEDISFVGGDLRGASFLPEPVMHAAAFRDTELEGCDFRGLTCASRSGPGSPASRGGVLQKRWGIEEWGPFCLTYAPNQNWICWNAPWRVAAAATAFLTP